MRINIKNAAAIRRLAARERVDLTEAVRRAVIRELERGGSGRARLRKMRAIADRLAELPILDNRSDDEILGYDSSGLPS